MDTEKQPFNPSHGRSPKSSAWPASPLRKPPYRLGEYGFPEIWSLLGRHVAEGSPRETFLEVVAEQVCAFLRKHAIIGLLDVNLLDSLGFLRESITFAEDARTRRQAKDCFRRAISGIEPAVKPIVGRPKTAPKTNLPLEHARITAALREAVSLAGRERDALEKRICTVLSLERSAADEVAPLARRKPKEAAWDVLSRREGKAPSFLRRLATRQRNSLDLREPIHKASIACYNALLSGSSRPWGKSRAWPLSKVSESALRRHIEGLASSGAEGYYLRHIRELDLIEERVLHAR